MPTCLSRMASRRPKRRRDPNRLGKLIVDISTGEANGLSDIKDENAAAAFGRLGGIKGGPARAASPSIYEGKRIAKSAAQARWKRKRGKFLSPRPMPATLQRRDHLNRLGHSDSPSDSPRTCRESHVRKAALTGPPERIHNFNMVIAGWNGQLAIGLTSSTKHC